MSDDAKTAAAAQATAATAETAQAQARKAVELAEHPDSWVQAGQRCKLELHADRPPAGGEAADCVGRLLAPPTCQVPRFAAPPRDRNEPPLHHALWFCHALVLRAFMPFMCPQGSAGGRVAAR